MKIPGASFGLGPATTRVLPGDEKRGRKTTHQKMRETPSPDDMLDALRLIGADKPELIELFDQIENLQFWIKDRQGAFVWVNLPLLVNFGLQKRSQVIGRTDFDIADATVASQYRADDEEVLKGRPIRSRVELVGRFNHTSLWHITSKIPLRDATGAVVGTAGVTMPYRQEDLKRPDSGLSNAIEYIIRHHGEQITNRNLAKACHISLRVFHRRFLETYHTSPHEYVRQYRVRASCNSLVFSTNSMAEIAQRFGFSDQSHYSREFRRLMNEAPSAYRNRFQQGIQKQGNPKSKLGSVNPATRRSAKARRSP
jgi:AraC-like DNA-binding protein